jgi:hypothetical protein
MNSNELLVGRAPQRDVHPAGSGRDRFYCSPGSGQPLRPLGVRLGRAVLVE